MNTDKRMKKLLREAVRLSERIDMLRREVYGEDCLDVQGEQGVPGRCPYCDRYVSISDDMLGQPPSYGVMCRHWQCGYVTDAFRTPEEAWREHERNCQKAEEDEG